ncbi:MULTISPECIES: spore germination protein GerPE [unclassified Paenibacillus]|uniref:spore germination protein GerPE n=1 Tax=unclassified Paenibacillus TaxID=185978 RepID=UPI001AE64E19|nr:MULTISPECIES: spore germination protein GerPE [unclassified Paenibacillus]MBP1156198.1 spore germination protein PE [Paenibacillus sp. PvP091]MBP1168416.1 spore germination protein PE [Paenibacillus sp. PvR098]MBP2439444.1 spore germination protein PE [Paenibacillus sp. PvP052]
MALPVRTSVVNRVMIYSIGYASFFNVGDIGDFSPVTFALAVQREIPVFYGNEGNLRSYPLFTSPIPLPKGESGARMTVNHAVPVIRVNDVEVLAVSTSSIVQIGSIKSIRAESRIKHIRQLLRGLPPR